MCERIAIMNHGEIIALEKTGDLVRKIGGQKVSITLASSVQSVPDALAKFEPEWNLEQRKLTFALKDGEEVGPILEALHSTRLTVQHLETHQPDLEDVFIELTGSGK
jgi:ABC-2 type transport system ATP-binding protein